MTDHSETPDGMLRLLGGFQMSQALYVVARLGVADHLLEGPRSVAEVARRTGVDPDPMRRLLRLTATEGVFVLDGGADTVALGPLGSSLATDTPDSLRAVAMMWMETHYAPFAELWQTVHDGRTAAEHHFGRPFFDWLTDQPGQVAQFSRAMADLVGARAGTLAALEVAGTRHLVDVGGADGAVLAHLAAAHPHLHGTVFDLPHVATGATERLAAQGLTSRVGAVGGDFFHDVPAGADHYLACSVLHDWNDEQALRILRAVHAAAEPDARLTLVEVVLPEEDPPPTAALLDITMMAMAGGRERTRGQWADLLRRGGFTLREVTRPPGPFCLVEATRDAPSA